MKSNRINRVNTIPLRAVPLFLAMLIPLLGAGSCSRIGPGGEGAGFSPEETFYIEGYLRLIEARTMALDEDSLAAGRFNFLQEDLSADSLRAIASRISEDSPQRWQTIFEEIVRRKEIQANAP